MTKSCCPRRNTRKTIWCRYNTWGVGLELTYGGGHQPLQIFTLPLWRIRLFTFQADLFFKNVICSSTSPSGLSFEIWFPDWTWNIALIYQLPLVRPRPRPRNSSYLAGSFRIWLLCVLYSISVEIWTPLGCNRIKQTSSHSIYVVTYFLASHTYSAQQSSDSCWIPRFKSVFGSHAFHTSSLGGLLESRCKFWWEAMLFGESLMTM